MRRCLVIALAASLSVTQVAAQDPPRSLATAKAFGIARMHDGSPWAHAVVHLIEDADADEGMDIDTGELDRRSTATDERGRFALDVLAGRDYVGWTAAPVEPENQLCSKVVSGIRAGGRIEFRAEAEPRTAHRFIADLHELGDGASVTLRVTYVNSRERFELSPDQDGVFVLPPHPEDFPTAEIRDAKGVCVAIANLAFDRSPQVMHVPAPAQRKVRILNSQTKQPIQNAHIVAFGSGRRVELGITDDAGECTVALPRLASYDSDAPVSTPHMPWAFVFAPGFNAGMLNVQGRDSRGQVQELLPDGIDGACRMTPTSNKPLRVVLTADGKPIAGARLLLNFNATHQFDDNSSMGMTCRMVLVSGTDGAIEIPPAESRGTSADLHLRVDATLGGILPESFSARLPAWIPLWLEHDGESNEPIKLDLVRDLDTVELQLLRSDDHTPASDVNLAIGRNDISGSVAIHSDRLGRFRLVLPKKGPHLVAAALGSSGWCALDLDLDARQRPGAEPITTITLRRSIPLDITAIGPEGKKLEHLWGYLGSVQRSFVVIAEPTPEVPQQGTADTGTFIRWIADDQARNLLDSLYSGVTFTDAKATTFLPDIATEYQFNLGASVAGTWTSATARVEVEGKEPRIPVTVQVGG